jgi:hypothetical protein
MIIIRMRLSPGLPTNCFCGYRNGRAARTPAPPGSAGVAGPVESWDRRADKSDRAGSGEVSRGEAVDCEQTLMPGTSYTICGIAGEIALVVSGVIIFLKTTPVQQTLVTNHFRSCQQRTAKTNGLQNAKPIAMLSRVRRARECSNTELFDTEHSGFLATHYP